MGYQLLGTSLHGASTWWNVKERGAVGDGVANDTAAIQATIDSMPVGGGVLYLPAGTYKITSQLTVYPTISIIGDGIRATKIQQASTSANGIYGQFFFGARLAGFRLEGPGSGTGKGILFDYPTPPGSLPYIAFEDMQVASFGSDGINLLNPIVSRFDNVQVETCGGHGIHARGTPAGAAGTSLAFAACYMKTNAQSGFRLYRMTYCHFSGCAADHNGIGYDLEEVTGVTLSGCGVEAQDNNGGSYPGVGYKITNSTSVNLINSFLYDNRNIGWWVTGTSSAINLESPVEITPNASATLSVRVDSGNQVTLSETTLVTKRSIAGGTTTTNPQPVKRFLEDRTDFLNGITGSSYTSVTANGGSVAAQNTSWFDAAGVVQIQITSTGSGTAGIITGTSDIAGGCGRHTWSAKMQLSNVPDGTDDFLPRFGLLDAATAAPTDGVWFELDRAADATHWRVCTAVGGAATKTTTSTTADTSWHTFTVVYDGAAATPRAEFFIDGTSVGSSTTNVPVLSANAFGFGAGVAKVGAGTNVRAMRLDYALYELEFSAVRG
jgi:hypothetical protein